jgi:hypothetical protein
MLVSHKRFRIDPHTQAKTSAYQSVENLKQKAIYSLLFCNLFVIDAFYSVAIILCFFIFQLSD